MRAPITLLLGAFTLLAGAGCKDAPAAPPTPAAVEQVAAKVVAEEGGVRLCEHAVPADECTRCDASLIETFKTLEDWCEEHGIPKSHDKQCDPKLTFTAAVAVDWCVEHGLPDSKCTKCNTKLIASYIEAGDYCREHGFPESACPFCHPELVTAAGKEMPVFPEPGTKVRLASAETEREIGIETRVTESRLFAGSIEVVGQLEFDQNRLARLSARGEATIVEVKVDVGDDVRKGQPLVALASAGIGADQSRLVATRARVESSRAALEREEKLFADGISSRKDVESARTDLAEATAEWESAKSALDAAGASGGAGGRYVLSAPFDGTVVGRDAIAGRSVSAEDALVEIADLRTIWAILEIPEEHASRVKPGQKVTLTFDGDGTREGKISRVAASVDPDTRTVRARVDLANADRSLKAGLYFRAKIETANAKEAILVPRESLQRAQGQALVFVRAEPGVYDPVRVEVGMVASDVVEVVAGLQPGMDVVTTGAFLLKTEILKDSIGAGCADDH